MKVTIYNIALCSYGTSCGGGDIFLSKVIPRLARKYFSVACFGYNTFGKDLSPRRNLKSISLLSKNIQRKQSNIEIGLLYFMLFFKSLKYLKPVDTNSSVVISHSDAWPDALFAFFFKKKNRNVKWIAINHLILPGLFKGYKNAYTGKFKIPSAADIYQWINQRVFFLLQKKADLLVSINSNDRDYLLNKNKNVFIIRHGREYTGEIESDLSAKSYDVCYLGRFFEQKGIDEIPSILDNLARIMGRKISVIFIGRQNNYSRWLEKQVTGHQYEVAFAGFKSGEAKFDLLKKSKVLILPSYFESFGIVYLDALSVGVPVVEYDLPCFADHKFGVIKVPFQDNDAFAAAVCNLLSDEKLYSRLSFQGYRFSQDFSWDKTAESLDKYIEAWCRPERIE